MYSFHESKEIHSFETVKAFFKNVFYEYVNEIEDCHAGLTEKNHEISFYIGDSSMDLIHQGDQITIWKHTLNENIIIGFIEFHADHCSVKYVHPVQVRYLCEDEINGLFYEAFQQTGFGSLISVGIIPFIHGIMSVFFTLCYDCFQKLCKTHFVLQKKRNLIVNFLYIVFYAFDNAACIIM